VHCAGSEVIAPLRATKDAQFALAMDALVIAYGLLAAAATSGVMSVDGGSVVLISSAAAHKGTVGLCAYAAGKGAIEALARSAAVELAPRSIRVNCVAPGAFLSPMHDRITGMIGETGTHAYEDKHLLGFGTVEDVAGAALFLLRPSGRWITGTTMTVDGGITA
jgi:NAD(P)-dependent dehydrogenase (short-subunit alcohol dehydrogenase family)